MNQTDKYIIGKALTMILGLLLGLAVKLTPLNQSDGVFDEIKQFASVDIGKWMKGESS